MSISGPISESAGAVDRSRSDEQVSTLGRRIIASIVALIAAMVLGMAAWLTPSPTGLGTHRAINLPPCGWIVAADLPCPTCGMTTAFAHAANGNMLASFHAQPLGCLLAIATAMALLVSLHTACTGSRLHKALAKLWTRRTAWLVAGMVVAAWGYKIVSYKGWIG